MVLHSLARLDLVCRLGSKGAAFLDKKYQKIVLAITIRFGRPHGDIKDQKMVLAAIVCCGRPHGDKKT